MPTSENYDPEIHSILNDPKAATDWTEITCPDEINFLLKLRNQQHFYQAETDKTPFTQPSLAHHLNWSASTNQAELVLEGAYKNSELNTISRLLINYLKQVTDLDSLTPEVSAADMRQKYSKWRGKTSTSPSGRHLSH